MAQRSMTSRCAFVLAALLGAAGTALAQSEYRMDDAGNWVQVRTAQAGTDDATIAQARRDLAEERPADAQALLDEWLNQNERTQNPLLPEAFLLRGDAQTAQGDEYDALYDYERVIKEYPGSSAYLLAVERELDLGVRYVSGLRRTFLGMRVVDATDIGEELLIRVQERAPGSRLAERAGIELADHYYRSSELQLAVEAYDLFVELYPNSQYRQRAMQRRIYATIGRFKGPRYDGSVLIDAKILTRRFASLYPQAAQEAGLDEGLIARLDESSAQELMENARWYIARDDDVSARLLLKRLIRDHPRTAAAAEALKILQTRGWITGAGDAAGATKDAPAKSEAAPAETPKEPATASPSRAPEQAP